MHKGHNFIDLPELYTVEMGDMDEHAQRNKVVHKQPFTDFEIREAFSTFDMNGKEYVGAAEIRFVMDALGE